ncbi:C40 family peptidase [Curvibacter sp. RS43]|uniref:C40 family peptidase n=1 Tax=Curvibacter microcysteis TaxID=3026419 RepID=UPI00235F6B42|nr:C40 family peptidase [Curvibacter sp. RS43]MDD0809615.1 C40 family peptidase [Curvibacter sp. RS43]
MSRLNPRLLIPFTARGLWPSRAASAEPAFTRRTHLLAWLGAASALGLAGCAGSPPKSQPRPTALPPEPQDSPELAAEVPATLSEADSQAVTLYALGLVGTPYRYGGNTPESGFDCSGLIRHVYRTQAGLPAPRTVAQLQFWGRPVPPAARRTGDLVLFTRGGQTSHAGIYVGQGRFVHAPSTGGQVRLEPLTAPHWSRQQVAYRRP